MKNRTVACAFYVAGITGKNLLLNTVFFLAACIITALIYGDTFDRIKQYLVSSYIRLPYTSFFSILICSAGYIISILFISVLAAERDKNLFSTSLIIRLMVYFLSILPIAVFRDGLSMIFGFYLIYYPISCFFIQFIVEKCRPFLLLKCGTSEPACKFVKVIVEIVPLMIGVFLVYIFMPEKFRHVDWRSIKIELPVPAFVAYLVYIVFFNCVTFFTVEFGITCVNEENKKNHAKYYFRYHDKKTSRFFYLLRSASSQMLGQMQKNIAWLVFFIITVESIFEFKYTIGRNLIEGYGNDSLVIMQNVFYLFFITFILNTFIDILSYMFDKNTDYRGSCTQCFNVFLAALTGGMLNPFGVNKKQVAKDSRNMKQKHRVQFRLFLPGKKSIVTGSIYFVVFILLLAFCLREYPMAGYYDFESNCEKTMAEIIGRYWPNPASRPSMPENELQTPLCVEGEDGGYYITKLLIIDPYGIQSEIVPYYEKSDDAFYFIQGNRNRQESLNGTIVSVSRLLRYKTISRFFSFIPVLGKMKISFRLPVDTSKSTFSMKPLYLVFPFFVLYFMTLFVVVYAITSFFFRYNIKRYIIKNIYESMTTFEQYCSLCHGILLKFINSSTLFVIFILVNFFLGKYFYLEWGGMNLFQSLAMFGLVQLLIIWMFSDSYVQGISLHIERIFKSKEFEYYELIGFDHNMLYVNYLNKYGNCLFGKLLLQNIIFVANINFFISYAFNVWHDFIDRVGLTYAISIENIFTKIIHFEKGRVSVYFVYIILFLFYGFLFVAYYSMQKRQEKNGR